MYLVIIFLLFIMLSPTDPNHTLNTLVRNTRGIRSCLLDQYSVDLALICEHKLFSHSREFLGLIHKDYNYISVESCSITPYSLATCGKGGLAILTKKTLPCYVSHIDTGGSERIIGVELKYHNMSPMILSLPPVSM